MITVSQATSYSTRTSARFGLVAAMPEDQIKVHHQRKQDKIAFSQINAIFNRTHCFKSKVTGEYDPVDFKELWSVLPHLLKEKVRPFFRASVARTAETLCKQGKLGDLEEVSDVSYELSILKAVKKGYITLDDVEQTMQFIQRSRGSDSGIEATRAFVQQLLDPKQVKRLAVKAGISEAQSLERLVHTTARFALLRMEGRFQDLEQGTRAQLADEYDEVLERLPENATKTRLLTRHKQRILSFLESVSPATATRILGQLLIGNGSLDLKKPFEAIQQFISMKHELRAWFHVSKKDSPQYDYNNRKNTTGPIERLGEAFIISQNR